MPSRLRVHLQRHVTTRTSGVRMKACQAALTIDEVNNFLRGGVFIYTTSTNMTAIIVNYAMELLSCFLLSSSQVMEMSMRCGPLLVGIGEHGKATTVVDTIVDLSYGDENVGRQCWVPLRWHM